MIQEVRVFADRRIPATLGLTGVAAAIVWVLASTVPVGALAVAMPIITAIVQGVLVAGAAVYCNQIFKQSGKGE